MPTCLALAGMYPAESPAESRDHLPSEVSRLLAAAPGEEGDDAWAAFVATYSGLLLRVSSAFAPGYDGALDRYAFMLDELRKGDCRRLRKFAADGRGRFSTWLTVVARRLCLDQHRRQYGRFRGAVPPSSAQSLARSARRELTKLDAAVHEVGNLPAVLGIDPTDEMDDRDRRAALRRAVGRASAGGPVAASAPVRAGSHGAGNGDGAGVAVAVSCVSETGGSLPKAARATSRPKDGLLASQAVTRPRPTTSGGSATIRARRS